MPRRLPKYLDLVAQNAALAGGGSSSPRVQRGRQKPAVKSTSHHARNARTEYHSVLSIPQFQSQALTASDSAYLIEQPGEGSQLCDGVLLPESRSNHCHRDAFSSHVDAHSGEHTSLILDDRGNGTATGVRYEGGGVTEIACQLEEAAAEPLPFEHMSPGGDGEMRGSMVADMEYGCGPSVEREPCREKSPSAPVASEGVHEAGTSSWGGEEGFLNAAEIPEPSLRDIVGSMNEVGGVDGAVVMHEGHCSNGRRKRKKAEFNDPMSRTSVASRVVAKALSMEERLEKIRNLSSELKRQGKVVERLRSAKLSLEKEVLKLKEEAKVKEGVTQKPLLDKIRECARLCSDSNFPNVVELLVEAIVSGSLPLDSMRFQRLATLAINCNKEFTNQLAYSDAEMQYFCTLKKQSCAASVLEAMRGPMNAGGGHGKHLLRTAKITEFVPSLKAIDKYEKDAEKRAAFARERQRINSRPNPDAMPMLREATPTPGIPHVADCLANGSEPGAHVPNRAAVPGNGMAAAHCEGGGALPKPRASKPQARKRPLQEVHPGGGSETVPTGPGTVQRFDVGHHRGTQQQNLPGGVLSCQMPGSPEGSDFHPGTGTLEVVGSRRRGFEPPRQPMELRHISSLPGRMVLRTLEGGVQMYPPAIRPIPLPQYGSSFSDDFMGPVHQIRQTTTQLEAPQQQHQLPLEPSWRSHALYESQVVDQSVYLRPHTVIHPTPIQQYDFGQTRQENDAMALRPSQMGFTPYAHMPTDHVNPMRFTSDH